MVVSVSNAVNSCAAVNSVRSEKRRVVYNGLDVRNKFWVDENTRISNGDVSHLTILMYGRLLKWKGFHVLVDALGLVKKEILQSIRCKIAGSVSDFDYMDELEASIEERKLNEIVQFIGEVPRSAIPSEIRLADVVIHASIQPDPLPTVVLEGMAMGKIVIATRGGGVEEMVNNGFNGFLPRRRSSNNPPTTSAFG